MTQFEAILFDVHDGVATITLNRPERMNALSWRMLSECSTALKTCDADDAIRAVVLTGAGKAFCAGADMGGGDETFAAVDGGSPVAVDDMYPWQCRKPVIAAVNGHAVGGGLTYPMMCDIRIIAEDAKLAFVFVRRGVIPELGSHSILPAVVGLSNAADLLLTGRTFRGTEAVDLGLASRALPAEEVLPAALEIARDIAANTAPAAVAISKQLLWRGSATGVDDMQDIENERFFWLAGQPDAVEGVMSFVEKRPARWILGPDDIPEFDS